MKPQQNTYDYGECEIYDTSKRILETELPEDSECPQEVQRLSWLMGTSWRLRSVVGRGCRYSGVAAVSLPF